MVDAATLTLKLAAVVTFLLLLIGVPLGWFLARARGVWGDIAGALIALPLVLPPTVLGFYLLIGLGPHGPLAPLLAHFGLRTLAFSFTGLVIGCSLHSLPFMVQPVRAAFRAMGDSAWEAALTLRAAPLDAFCSIALPSARGGILTGAILSFAHTIGEFGVVLMVGGNIPGKTQVLSIVVFNDVDNFQWAEAARIAAGMAAFSFAVIFATFWVERRLGRDARA